MNDVKFRRLNRLNDGCEFVYLEKKDIGESFGYLTVNQSLFNQLRMVIRLYVKR